MKISFFMQVNNEERCVGIAEMPESPAVGDRITLYAGPESAARYLVVDRMWRMSNKQKTTAHMETQLHVLVELSG